MPNLAPAAPATPTYDGVAPLTEEQNAALSEDSDEDEEEDLMFLDDDEEAPAPAEDKNDAEAMNVPPLPRGLLVTDLGNDPFMDNMKELKRAAERDRAEEGKTTPPKEAAPQ